MVDETTRLAEQLRRAFEGEAWHGPSLHDLYHAGQIALLKRAVASDWRSRGPDGE